MDLIQSTDDLWKQKPEVIRFFVESRALHEKLAREVSHSLERLLNKAGIPYANVSYRTKSLESICEKILRKQYGEPTKQITDFAGVRVVYLYSSDLQQIEDIISKEFLILEKVDRRIAGSSDKFGYGALHYLLKLGKSAVGARYDDLKNAVCEVQVRTILQDAWAIVDHHLKYKKESDVPLELRRKLHALAGLFETADDQFDRLSAERKKYAQKVSGEIEKSASSLVSELNLDSFVEYLKIKYPTRKNSSVSAAAELLGEIKGIGVKTIQDLDSILWQTEKAFEFYENAYPPGAESEPTRKRKFYAVGVVRISMELFREDYRLAGLRKNRVADTAEFKSRVDEARQLLRAAR